VLWSRQIYANDSFMVGCAGSSFTENCPKVVGPDWDIPMSPMLTEIGAGRDAIVFGTKPGDVLALDPDRHGALLWRVSAVPASAGEQPKGRRNLGPLWGGAIDGGHVYFGLNAGGVVALRLADGGRVWYTPLESAAQAKATYSAATTVIPGVVFVAGSDGRLWALASADGHPLWSYDTARTFSTVNAVPAHGGSIDSAGPIVAGGMLFVGSGYGVVTGTPGNVLLAFALK
jgi:polyvinyl alcohol dehydrogenase (cytochrome)